MPTTSTMRTGGWICVVLLSRSLSPSARPNTSHHALLRFVAVTSLRSLLSFHAATVPLPAPSPTLAPSPLFTGSTPLPPSAVHWFGSSPGIKKRRMHAAQRTRTLEDCRRFSRSSRP